MKKILLYIITILLVINTCGCKKSTLNGTSVIKKFDIEQASKTVSAYMKADMKNDVNGMDKLYSNSYKKKVENKTPNNVIITGYKFDETMQTGDSAMISVKTTKINTTAPYAMLETYSFKVVKEDNKYKVKEINTKNEKEVFPSGNSLRMRLKDNAKTLLVTNTDGIPKYYYEQKDKAKANMLPVNRGEFGVTALTYEGTSGAISTKGNNAFIEVVRFEEAMMTQGGTDKGGGGDTSGGGAAGGTEGQNNMAPEKPLSKEIVPIDVIPDGVITNMVFSQDERYLAVQYTKSNLGSSIRIYKNKTGEQSSFDFEKNYPIQKVDVTINSFEKEGLIYTITPKDNYKNDSSLKDISGKWQIDTKKFKPMRVKG